MQTSEEENMKIWKLIKTSCSDCIKMYREENKKDTLERDYEARVDFWNRYIEDQLANIELPIPPYTNTLNIPKYAPGFI